MGINPETCGISAAQKFAGEDGSIKERSRIQATQMKSWCDEQLILKQEREEQDMYWAQNNQEITASLAAQEADEETWRTSQRYELRDDHLHQRREHRLKQKFLKKELGEGAIGQGFYSQFGSNARCRHKSELLVKNMPPFT